MVLDTTLLNTQQYKIRIKGKVGQSRERSNASPTSWCSSYWKGSLLVALDYGRQLYLLLYVRRIIEERLATRCITLTIKLGCIMVCVGLLPIAKSGICTRWKANWIRQVSKHTAASRDFMRSAACDSRNCTCAKWWPKVYKQTLQEEH